MVFDGPGHRRRRFAGADDNQPPLAECFRIWQVSRNAKRRLGRSDGSIKHAAQQRLLFGIRHVGGFHGGAGSVSS